MACRRWSTTASRICPPIKVYAPEYKRPDKSLEPTRPFTVTRTGEHEFTIDAPWLERHSGRHQRGGLREPAVFPDPAGRFRILDKLVAEGVEEDDTIKIGEYEFDYLY